MILGVPSEAITHSVHFDPKFFCRLVFAVTVLARLHKLDHATLKPAPGRAHHQPQRTSGLAFAIARVDDQQPTGFLLIVFPAPLVFFLLCCH